MRAAQDNSSMVKRLNTGPLVLLTCTIISFIFTVFMGLMAQDAQEKRIKLIQNAGRFAAGSKTLTDEVRAFAASLEKSHYDAYRKEINDDRNREIGLDGMRAVGITADEELLISRMAEISDKLVPMESEAIKKALEGDRDAALDYVFGQSYADAMAKIGGINAEFQALISKRSQDKVDMYNTILQCMGAMTGIFIVSVIVLQVRNMHFVYQNLADPMMKIRTEMQRIAEGKIMTKFEMSEDDSEVGRVVSAIKNTKRNLRKYIGDISHTLKLMAEGRLDTDIEIDYIGDFAPIKESLDGILDSLNDVIHHMSDSVAVTAAAVTDRAERVLSGADELAIGSGDQARTIEMLSSSVSELANEMNGIADSAARSHESTNAAAAELAESSARMHDMQSAMNEISQASDGIKKITEAIGNIGSRTNIVAINAAIEAAKAGDVGRGFAVVAGEVRNLAILCGDASRDTNALLDSTMKAVSRGLELTHDLTDAMQKLIDTSRASAADIADISDHSKKQADALKDVADGFEQITTVVRKNASTAEVSANAAKELNRQATNLKELQKLFDNFTLRGSKSR